MTGNFSATDPIKRHCSYCKDSGWIAIRSRDGSYAFAGAVPDGAKGFVDADCWFCDSGPPLCDTCLGTGEIDERLGGEPSSNIVACPDCDTSGRGTVK